MQIFLWISVFAQLPVNQPHRHFALWKCDEIPYIGTKSGMFIPSLRAPVCSAHTALPGGNTSSP